MILGALLALALNIRPAAIQIGPVLNNITADLGLSATSAGLLTSLPTLAFAGFGALAPGMSARFGAHRSIIAALGLMIVGQAVRPMVDSELFFLLLSLVALAGMATANVLLPSLVRQHFPQRIGLITAMYSTSMMVGVSMASMLTVPLAQALGGWRPALGFAALLAFFALVPWFFMLRHDRGHRTSGRSSSISLRVVARTKLGWLMAIFFGSQSAMAYSIFGWLPSIYMSAGATAQAAGYYQGIVTGLGIPLAFVLPAYTSRNPRPMVLLVAISCCALAADLGLMLAPMAAPVLWALLMAAGISSFPMILALIGLRSSTTEGTAALSGFAQSVGYLLASAGPFLVGLLHELSGGWSWSIGLLMALLIPLTLTSLSVARAGTLEEELGR